MNQKRENNAWLHDALADRDLLAKDVAEAWCVDDAVVSRFINIGEPELTWSRAHTLCHMLRIDMNDLARLIPPGSGMPELTFERARSLSRALDMDMNFFAKKITPEYKW
jgi:hypothetical protein